MCSQDVIFRIGADEFLVIRPDTDALAVHGFGERLLAAAESRIIDSSPGQVLRGGAKRQPVGTVTLVKAVGAGV